MERDVDCLVQEWLNVPSKLACRTGLVFTLWWLYVEAEDPQTGQGFIRQSPQLHTKPSLLGKCDSSIIILRPLSVSQCNRLLRS